MSLLLKEKYGRVLLLVLNRPDVGNRVSEALALDLIAALEEGERDADIGAVVLTGAGDKFCIGGDHAGSGNTADAILRFAGAFGHLARRLETFGKPVLGAINGDAHAGGFSLLTACDLAVMSEAAELALPELAHGLFPILAMATVQRVVSRKLFFELAYEGRRLSAAEARDLWLVNEVAAPADVVSRTVDRAQKIALSPASSMMLGRQGYAAMLRGDLDAALDYARPVLPLMAGLRG